MRPKNWKRFQHFKDRKPPWIKLYRDLLDDIDFHRLDGEAAKFLIQLWLIASEDDAGELPDIEVIAFRLRVTERDANAMISRCSKWLEGEDITMISERYQDDPLETETETETEKKQSVCVSDPGFDELWKLHARGPKAKAKEAYRKALRETDHETIMTALRAYVRSFRGDWKGAHLFRWLTDARWEEAQAPEAKPDYRPASEVLW